MSNKNLARFVSEKEVVIQGFRFKIRRLPLVAALELLTMLGDLANAIQLFQAVQAGSVDALDFRQLIGGVPKATLHLLQHGTLEPKVDPENGDWNILLALAAEILDYNVEEEALSPLLKAGKRLPALLTAEETNPTGAASA